MKFHDIKNLIAKAIQEADEMPCPDGYAGQAGYLDHDWLSDWGAFLADHVVEKLESHGLAIRGRFLCTSCGKFFLSNEDKEQHRLHVHMPHRKLSSRDRPAALGPILCGYGGCNQSFKNEWNATQHRRMAHDWTADRCSLPSPTNTGGGLSDE
jgi:hypothetical protein